MAQMAGSVKSKNGTFIGDGRAGVDLQIGFEPDVIIINLGLPLNVAGPVGLYMLAIAKNVFTLNVGHNSTTDKNPARTIFSQLYNTGWGDKTLGAYRNYATYENGVLTISNVNVSPSAQCYFINGQEYTWTAYKA